MAYAVINGRIVKIQRTWVGDQRGRGINANTTNVAQMAAANHKAATKKKPAPPLDSMQRIEQLARGLLAARKMDLADRHAAMYGLADEAKSLGIKGALNGMCNRTQCLDIPATWYNHSTRKHYCEACAKELNNDRFNKADAQQIYGHDLCTPTMERRLTKEAQAERDQFDSEYGDAGCICFISPPCNYCTHPGNPMNQDEDESCWELVPIQENA